MTEKPLHVAHAFMQARTELEHSEHARKEAEKVAHAYARECRRIHANGENWSREYAYKVIGRLIERHPDWGTKRR